MKYYSWRETQHTDAPIPPLSCEPPQPTALPPPPPLSRPKPFSPHPLKAGISPGHSDGCPWPATVSFPTENYHRTSDIRSETRTH
ncbi:hypothetical protein E2C01_091081 [Portunus trituberculatus]|uniref:Uncharacterized protein n=1 Tax=Portunus trituberculatus TaxID=210409 RepID=A0A5B7JI85_PORTR|nr:hypothetical protein [Portunus trituberculatus]